MNSVGIDKIQTLIITTPTGIGVPSGGLNGELGAFVLKSDVINNTVIADISANLQSQIDDINLTDITQNNEINSLQTEIPAISAQLYFDLQKKLERDRTGLLVPLYIYPTNGGNIPEYLNLISLKNAYHVVPLYVIINPGIIPSSTLDLNYQMAIRRLKSCNTKVIGYVATTYTSAAASYVKSQIDTWTNLYDIDGMMFDEMTSDINQSHYNYYTDLTNYCHTKNLYPVIGNAGTTVPSGYFDNKSADIFVVYEAAGYTSEDTMKNGYGAVGNYQLYPYTNRAHLFHTVDYSNIDLTIAEKYTGLLYATSDTMPNPWDTLSPYAESLFSLLSGMPSGSGGSTQYTQNASVPYSVKSGDNRTLAPVDVSISTPGFQFLFGSVNANNTTPFADIITCSTWNDGTGGGINQLALSKADGTMYHKFGTFAASGWSWTRMIWDDGNDGSGSGLDSDLLDGQHGSYYTNLINQKTSSSNYVTYSIAPGDLRTVSPSSFGGLGHYFYFTSLNNDNSNPWADAITLNSYADGTGGAVNTLLFDKFSTNIYHRQGVFGAANFGSLIKIWDDSNDGTGSNLDADLLDGQHGSYYTNYSNSTSANALVQANAITYSASANALVQSAAMSANALAQSISIATAMSANSVTLDTPQTISGLKKFSSQVELNISGDKSLFLDTYNISGYSELSWSLNEVASFGLYTSYNLALSAASWTTPTNGRYWGLYGYDKAADLVTVDVSGTMTIAYGNLNILTLNAASSGNFLTWNNSGSLVDSGLNKTTISSITASLVTLTSSSSANALTQSAAMSANALVQSAAMSANAFTQSKTITFAASANALTQSAAMSANALVQSAAMSANAYAQTNAMSANAYIQAKNSASSSSTTWTSLNANQLYSTQTVYVSASTIRTYIGCNVTGGPIMVVLPNSPPIFQEVLVKHEGGNITNNNITVSGGINNIDDFPAHILDQDYSGYIYIYSNSQWRIF